MSAPIPVAEPATAPDPRIARAEQRLAMLRELAELGMDLARALAGRAVEVAEAAASEPDAKPAPAPAPRHDPAESFARLSRAIRLTLALEAQVEDQRAALIAGETTAAETRRAEAADRAATADAKRRETVHYRVVDLVAEAMEAEIDGEEALDDCHTALLERLEEDEAYDGYHDRSLRETVERLCTDLGLSPDWSLWDDEMTAEGIAGGWALTPAGRGVRSVFNRPSRIPLCNGEATAPNARLE